jgi:hypothetical protein
MTDQVGGCMHALQEHVLAVQQHPLFGSDIDFKLAKSDGACSKETTKESNFDKLAINVCKVRPRPPSRQRP